MSYFSYRILIRIVIIFTVALIIWQTIRLLSQNKNVEISEVISPEDDILKLEDSSFNEHRLDKVKIKVFYEALCPDSRHFFIHHLLTVAENLAEFTSTILVPYGKATTRRSKSGKYEFECQHGAPECHGNKLHACAIDALPNVTQAVQMVTCLISDNNTPESVTKCSERYRISAVAVESCAKGDRGSELLNMYGVETKPIEPIDFIPTIALNGSFGNQAAILKNLKREVCKIIGMPLPPGCLS